MIRAGILTDNDHVKLLEGWLVQKISKNPPLRIAAKLMTKALEQAVPNGWYVDSQEPITTETSEPEPDVAVIRGDTRDYAKKHPGPKDVGMVVEIADATLEQDRRGKLRVYAGAGIAVYWIVNLAEREIEVYTESSVMSSSPGYGSVQHFQEGSLVPLVLDGVCVGEIAVSDVLP